MTSLLTKKINFFDVKEHFNREKNWLKQKGEKWKNTKRQVYKRDRKIKAPISPYSRKAEYYQVDQATKTVIPKGKTSVGHIYVPLKEAHSSGGINWPTAKKNAFAHFQRNLGVQSQDTNYEQGKKNFGQWQPTYDKKQHALGVEAVKKEWNLTSDPAEFKALSKVLGRKPKLKVAPKVENTMVCMQCHANRPYKKKP
tara:strand:- start:4421 stop:5011 length:591 start_codon:yes stop_codon:yes gene_type:complete